MSQDLPPVPHGAPITDQRTAGLLTPVWSDWFKKAFARMGGHIAPTNNDPITSSRIAAGAVNTAALGALSVTTAKLDTSVSAFLIPTGGLVAFAGSSAPTGFLLCDGSAISRTTFATLFAAIGTAFGTGDGSTTFNLPNTKGVFLRGAGSQTIGGISYTGTLGTAQGDQLQGHLHSMTGAGAAEYSATADNLHTGTFATRANGSISSVSNPSSDGTNGTPRTGLETRPANLSVNWIIKT